MTCDCYGERYLPTILRLEEASDNMPFALREFDAYQQKIHDIIVDMNTNFRCINRCHYTLIDN